MTKQGFSRRDFMRRTGSLVAASAATAALPGMVAAMGNVTVGFIYVGPRQDYGWNQSHWDAAKKVAAIDGVTVVEQENVPETAEVEKVIQSMIELDGAKVIFGTSFGYWDSLKKMAIEYPDVLFTHIGAIWKEGDPTCLSNAPELANDRHPPASTFKIPNSLIAVTPKKRIISAASRQAA